MHTTGSFSTSTLDKPNAVPSSPRYGNSVIGLRTFAAHKSLIKMWTLMLRLKQSRPEGETLLRWLFGITCEGNILFGKRWTSIRGEHCKPTFLLFGVIYVMTRLWRWLRTHRFIHIVIDMGFAWSSFPLQCALVRRNELWPTHFLVVDF